MNKISEAEFFNAIETGDLAAVRAHLEQQPEAVHALDTRTKIRAESLHTPLHRAAKFGQVYIARLLLEHGADIDAAGFHGTTRCSRLLDMFSGF